MLFLFTYNEIFNYECKVIPPGRSNAVMSEEATHSIILPLAWKWLQSNLYRKVLLIFTGPWPKNVLSWDAQWYHPEKYQNSVFDLHLAEQIIFFTKTALIIDYNLITLLAKNLYYCSTSHNCIVAINSLVNSFPYLLISHLINNDRNPNADPLNHQVLYL